VSNRHFHYFIQAAPVFTTENSLFLRDELYESQYTIKTMNKFIIAGIGELLWDVLEESEELGGAPVNFSYHANSLGAKGYAISTVGDDRRGKAALAVLEKRKMSTRYITVREGSVTGYVLANVDDKGVASYSFPDDVAWDHLTLAEPTLSLAKEVDAICFGSLGQRSPKARLAIVSFLQATRPDTLRIFDINLRQHFYTTEIIQNSLKLANVLKLNNEELEVLGVINDIKGDESSLLKKLVEKYNLQLAVLTRGGKGSLLVSPADISSHPGCPTNIVDTIGAGDSFTAATALGLLKGYNLSTINDHANRVAAFVCSQKGAMPLLPVDLRENISKTEQLS